jgi:lysophospholipase L1-like esterase
MSSDDDFFTLLLEASYKNRVEWFRELNKDVKKGGIVLVGDSLTHEFLIHEMMDAYGRIHNRGIGGDTTSGLLKRINESILDLNPKKVFLLIGTNDLTLFPNEHLQLVENIRKIIDKTLSTCKDVQFYLISLYPINDSNEPKIDKFSVTIRSNEIIDHVNLMLKQLADKTGVFYLNFNSLLKDNNGNLKLEYTREGLHLSPAGYKVILKELQKYF